MSLWFTDADVFEHGQWLKGRVYERRSDLSADGSLFVAFVRKTEGRTLPDWDTWVAISRPPWFTALAYWSVGGTYHTGAYFTDRRSIWPGFTPDPPDVGTLPSWLLRVQGLPAYVDGTNSWPERTVWVNRLLRDGWRRIDGAAVETWEHRQPDTRLVLLMKLRSDADFAAYGGPHIVEYAVQMDSTGTVAEIGQATWADWDQRGRLIVAKEGRLWHWQPPGTLCEIADFNGQTPEPAPAPDWAREWPESPTATG
jgi:hypothetical protein